VLAVADHVRRHPLGDRDHAPADHQHPVVVPGDEGLDDDAPASRLSKRPLECHTHALVVADLQRDTAPVVAVEWLDHHWEADSLGRDHRFLLRPDQLQARDRQSRRREQRVGEALVHRDVHTERRRARGHRGPDPLLIPALPQLHQRSLVETDVGDVAPGGLVDERLRRGAERSPLGQQDQVLDLLEEVEPFLGLDQMVHQADREPSGGDADPLLAVAVDDVVLAGHAGAAGLASVDVRARLPLQGDRDVLRDVADPGALVQTLDESTGPAERAGVLAEAGDVLEQRLGESRKRVRRPVLERSEVDQQADAVLVRPVVRPAEDLRLRDLEVGLRRWLRGLGFQPRLLPLLERLGPALPLGVTHALNPAHSDASSPRPSSAGRRRRARRSNR
jgi:hypothetical protein